jgi:hypothetical protein
MSAIGPKRTSRFAPHMSAFGGVADIRPNQRRRVLLQICCAVKSRSRTPRHAKREHRANKLNRFSTSRAPRCSEMSGAFSKTCEKHTYMVLPVWIEHTTSPLPRGCSTTELRQQGAKKIKSRKRGGNCHTTPGGASNGSGWQRRAAGR